ncbi:MAG: alpha-galactosidase [Candidatus Nanopelagicales bacterium]|nr:alpha-galactosidase [Candidatus Nanopelagicales bacterium]
MAPPDQPHVVHLRAGGTSVVLRLDADRLPCVLHWGPDLGPLSDADLRPLLAALAMPYVDSPMASQEAVALLPQHSSGWLGQPGLLGSREGRDWSVGFDEVTHEVTTAGTPGWADGPSGAQRLRSVGTDRISELEVVVELEVLASGLVRLRAAVRNLGQQPYQVDRLEPALPVPAEAGELLDMAGRHSHERTPQRRPFGVGHWVRESWGGRPGHDAATLLCAGQPGFAFRTGRVWGVHLACSGNQVLGAEHAVTGWRLLRGGERLLPGEVRLAAGQAYASPWLLGSWGEGLDELAGRFHRMLRARPQHPRRPRPVLLNVWEAVYFDHDLDRLRALADRAAELGIERFVLDDGWFRGRRDDRSGLGDWYVDEQVWPEGLAPLVDHVRGLGMEFGLWFEPEMVSLDSELATAHPDWLLRTRRGVGPASRHQHVLDLAHPDAFDHVLGRMSALIDEYGIAYVKWDHNRPLVEAGRGPAGTPGVHEQTAAAYRLMAELKARHPGLEIESCSAGGARVDLGILEHADRVWVSDCIDAHERHRIVRWTGLLLPPELMGTHVGSGVDHTTGRRHDLDFRAGTAMWGHMGVEWDLTAASPEERAELGAWIAFHQQVRALLHSGDVVHADLANPALQLEGVVAADRSEALYVLAALDHTLTWPPGRVPLPGLDPERTYRVDVPPPGDRLVRGAGTDRRVPGWVAGGAALTGRVLAEVGLQAPLLGVDQLVLLRAVAVPDPAP